MARRYRLNPITSAGPSLRDNLMANLYGSAPEAGLVPTSPEDVLYGAEPALRSTILLSRLLREQAVPRERNRFNMVE